MDETQATPQQQGAVPDIYPMPMDSLRNFNAMQQNVAQSLRLIVRNSGNPSTRNEAEVLLNRISRNIDQVDRWLAERPS